MTVKIHDILEVTWRDFDVDDRRGTRPPGTGWVWVYDPDIYGVTFARYCHITISDETGFFQAPDGAMLVNVTHWAPITYPEEPEEVRD